jgi:hypothetical protein
MEQQRDKKCQGLHCLPTCPPSKTAFKTATTTRLNHHSIYHSHQHYPLIHLHQDSPSQTQLKMVLIFLFPAATQ